MIKNDVALAIEKKSEFNRAKSLLIVEAVLGALKTAGPPVALMLHQAGTDQGLIAGHQHMRLVEVVFVVEVNRSKWHGQPCQRGNCACRKDSYSLGLGEAKRPGLIERLYGDALASISLLPGALEGNFL